MKNNMEKIKLKKFENHFFFRPFINENEKKKNLMTMSN